MTTNPITNTADVIDSRDVIERLSYLDRFDVDDLDEDELAERAALRNLEDQASNYVDDWEYGVALIHDAYFVTHAQELADDIGAIDRDAGWPTSFIDWAAAAEALQMDYTALDFDGATYWAR